MLVQKKQLEGSLYFLEGFSELSLDTETTGLRPHHGDKLLSIIIGNGSQEYYFDFKKELGSDCFEYFLPLFRSKKITWFLANAKFDLSFLRQNNLYLHGNIHDILAVERILDNDAVSYSLSSVAKKYGMEKSDDVDRYIEENKLWSWKDVPGKQTRIKHKHFDMVPIEILRPYAEQDARITFEIGKKQISKISGISLDTPKGIPNIKTLYTNESRLLRVVHEMEDVGVRIDNEYCLRAIAFEEKRMADSIRNFKSISGLEYKASPKMMEDIFSGQKSKWSYTEKGNPSFDSEALSKIDHPASKCILDIRDAKAKLDFYNGFLYHADKNFDIHPNFNQSGTATGRFSSSEPNFQNLISEEGDAYLNQEFLLRRAIVPRPDYIFIMPDYSAMEYRLMLEYSCCLVGYETQLIKDIKGGKDVHQATADLVTALGYPLTRSRAKNANFATLYGSGIKTLAETLGTTTEEAKTVKEKIFKAAPEIQGFIQSVMKAASNRGYIFNWMGRRSNFRDSSFSYKAPNYLIQGGCADIMKRSMVNVGDYLRNRKSRIVMTIHDELIVEVHKSDIETVPREVHRIMEQAYPSKYVPIECSMEWSAKSLADKQKGFPNESN